MVGNNFWHDAIALHYIWTLAYLSCRIKLSRPMKFMMSLRLINISAYDNHKWRYCKEEIVIIEYNASKTAQNYLLSGPAPDDTVSLTVRIATLTFVSGDALLVCLDSALLWIQRSVNPLLRWKLLISEISMACKEVPAGSISPVAGTSNKAFADLILKRRLLICTPVLSAMNLKEKLIYVQLWERKV